MAMKRLVLLDLFLLVFQGDFNERGVLCGDCGGCSVDRPCLFGRLLHSFLYLWPKDFVSPIVSDWLFLPMIGHAQLHVMGVGS